MGNRTAKIAALLGKEGDLKNRAFKVLGRSADWKEAGFDTLHPEHDDFLFLWMQYTLTGFARPAPDLSYSLMYIGHCASDARIWVSGLGLHKVRGKTTILYHMLDQTVTLCAMSSFETNPGDIHRQASDSFTVHHYLLVYYPSMCTCAVQ